VKAGKVAYLGQSGMLANAMVDWAAGRDVGFSHLITVGDSVDVLLPDLIDYVNQFSPAQAILLHLERVTDAQHLVFIPYMTFNTFTIERFALRQ
ncbi:hypothetical protein R0K19_21700, partial [Bacillus sp. SIMBA_161]